MDRDEALDDGRFPTGISLPGMVMLPEWDEEIPEAWEDTMARIDDQWWGSYLRLRFTWQRYYDWWVSRHAIIPRDPRNVVESVDGPRGRL